MRFLSTNSGPAGEGIRVGLLVTYPVKIRVYDYPDLKGYSSDTGTSCSLRLQFLAFVGEREEGSLRRKNCLFIVRCCESVLRCFQCLDRVYASGISENSLLIRWAFNSCSRVNQYSAMPLYLHGIA
jgi:hypothetical protein